MSPQSGVDESQGQPLRVLFVEHNPVDVELCLHELQKAGFQVSHDVAETPQEFLNRLLSHQYDMVLADYRMPGWTGLEALKQMQREKQEDDR